jgi:hypothetical protein
MSYWSRVEVDSAEFERNPVVPTQGVVVFNQRIHNCNRPLTLFDI